MKLIQLTILIVLFCETILSFAADSKIYRTRDAEGKVVYSDQAPEGAEEITVDKPETYTPTTRAYRPPIVKKPEAKKRVVYDLLTITSPKTDQPVRDNAGNVSASFAISPRLKPKHSIQLVVDGSVRQTTKVIAPIQIENLDRGSHQLQLRIIDDQSNEVLHSSQSISMTLMRHSILHTQVGKP